MTDAEKSHDLQVAKMNAHFDSCSTCKIRGNRRTQPSDLCEQGIENLKATARTLTALLKEWGVSPSTLTKGDQRRAMRRFRGRP